MTTVSEITEYQEVTQVTQAAFQALQKLQQSADFLQPQQLDGQEWYDLWRQKLLPQLGSGAWLVAAVVGGTNIGKSVIFNHLAGCRASSSSPMASGTKHPVCLVPSGFQDKHDLQDVFPDFTLHAWSDSDSALEENQTHDLFWRTAPELPSNLLVLDTPDIDSDARINWVRADAVRRSADILIAVLTQQKYNDAAVKEFFRKAAAEDKAVLLVFNQYLLPEDEEYWPAWIKTFCEETGINPEAVFLAPNDRRAAEDLKLPFYERPWPIPDGYQSSDQDSPKNLRSELAEMRFQEIRLRTLRGSLQEILRPTGLPAHLSHLKAASEDLAATSERLATDAVLRIRDWPTPPHTTFADEIRTWWKSRQTGWAKSVNSFYDTIGNGIAWPFRKARIMMQGEPIPPLEKYREAEWTAILMTAEELFDKLQWMADSGNPVVKPRIEALLQASGRSRLIELLRREHTGIDFEAELQQTVETQMALFSQDSPELFQLYKQLHTVGAAVRPVTSVVLFSIGMGPVSEAAAPFVANAAANAVIHIVTDVAGGTAVAAVGDKALSEVAGKGKATLESWFYQLQSAFTERRVSWLTALIKAELLGDLPEKIQEAANLPNSDEFKHMQTTLLQLKTVVAKLNG